MALTILSHEFVDKDTGDGSGISYFHIKNYGVVL